MTVDQLADLIYQMQMETWLESPEQKAKWLLDHLPKEEPCVWCGGWRS